MYESMARGDSAVYTQARRRGGSVTRRAGALLAALGALGALLGFFLPWLNFRSVVSAGSPSVAGYQLPAYADSTAFLVGLVAGREVRADLGAVWAVPLGAALALLVALVALAAPRASAAMGAVHLLLGAAVLALTGFVGWRLAGVVAGGLGSVLPFVGLGLWLALLGALLVLVGGVLELARR
jgi:hypothetical protein